VLCKVTVTAVVRADRSSVLLPAPPLRLPLMLAVLLAKAKVSAAAPPVRFWTGDLFSYSRTFASNKYLRPWASSALTKSAYAFISDRFLLAWGVPVGRHVHAANPSPTDTLDLEFFLTLKKGLAEGAGLRPQPHHEGQRETRDRDCQGARVVGQSLRFSLSLYLHGARLL
jgi:hypothetical protein